MNRFDSWEAELYHHGIKGQKWGLRRFQNEDGSLTDEGLRRYGDKGQRRSYEKTLNKNNKELVKYAKRNVKEQFALESARSTREAEDIAKRLEASGARVNDALDRAKAIEKSMDARGYKADTRIKLVNASTATGRDYVKNAIKGGLLSGLVTAAGIAGSGNKDKAENILAGAFGVSIGSLAGIATTYYGSKAWFSMPGKSKVSKKK